MFNKMNSFWVFREAPESAGAAPAAEPVVPIEPVAPASALSGAGEPATGEPPAPASTPAAEPAPAETPLLALDAFTIPEGFEIPEEIGGTFLAVLNDPKLDRKEMGQKFLDMYAANAKAAAQADYDAQTQAWDKMNADWRAEIDKLPGFEGRADAELGSIKQALLSKEVGATADFFKALDLTGAGNNPHIVQILHRLTRPYVEGGAVGGGPSEAARKGPTKMYPTMVKE